MWKGKSLQRARHLGLCSITTNGAADTPLPFLSSLWPPYLPSGQPPISNLFQCLPGINLPSAAVLQFCRTVFKHYFRLQETTNRADDTFPICTLLGQGRLHTVKMSGQRSSLCRTFKCQKLANNRGDKWIRRYLISKQWGVVFHNHGPIACNCSLQRINMPILLLGETPKQLRLYHDP